MSILDSVRELAGGRGGNSVIAVVGDLIQKSGGVSGLLATLKQGGLGGVVESWIGNGPNQPVSGPQLGQALAGGAADQQVAETAQKQGVDKASLYDELAKVLPAAVDHLTPNGQTPAGAGGFDLGQLSGLAGKLGL